MPDPVVHVEITGARPDLLRAFYAALFGWAAPPGDPVAAAVSDPDAYAFTPPGPASGAVPVGIGGGEGFASRVVFYVGVEDVAARLARAVELGATVVVEPSVRPDGAVTIAQFADPQGNIVGLAGRA
ncbi:hypothetical protein SAMN06295885_2164 [Rathayibacter oskolensis]|uniref:VOC domain-containing protein n=1 Tax=Rathayibacter oskolensis TaxID=1891671 RepID=A0A1X7NZV1_9MICO|nr:VOC family protein [Rathayibacter oskolensis]SMH43120.1 hypothetical protein SAMN06295885_2164 [Rathayibacter oskolensis]